VESLYHILSDPRLNHQPEVTGGVLADECGNLLKQFFKTRRGSKESDPANTKQKERLEVD
jgi:tRNA(adenine34) deaminase